MPDEIKIKILADGTIRLETDEVSAPNHLSAERLLGAIEKLCGAPQEVAHKHGKAHEHVHHHEHEGGA